MSDYEVGVGPYPKPWPKDPRLDPKLLKDGDCRNVLDKYRYWKVDAIKNDLDKTRVSLNIAIENWQRDFNMGTIIRSANAFNVDTVHIIGKKQWNKRGAMVTDKYINIEYHQTTDQFIKIMKSNGRQIISIDNVPNAKELSRSEMPINAVLVFGSEGTGLSDEILIASDKIVMIEQFGSTRSINVGVAAGIVMYEWLRQNVLKKACK